MAMAATAALAACGPRATVAVDDAGPAAVAREPPVAVEGETANVAEGARRPAADGATLVAVSFADDDGLAARRRWVRPAHGEAEVRARREELAAEAARLPDGERARVEPLLDGLATVSAVEGSFGDPTRIGTDLAASVGILQWAARRGRPVDAGTSLYALLAAIARRARAGEALARASQRELARAKIR